MKEAAYHRLTSELTLSTAGALVHLNPRLTFCYVSGEGTDGTERGRFMWARVKGQTENHLPRMPSMPSCSVQVSFSRLRCPLENEAVPAFYIVLGPLYPLLRRLLPRHVTTTESVGRAMIQVAASGYSKHVLEKPDINLLAVTA